MINEDYITEDYVSYEVAKLLKDKGFEIDTNRDYWKIGEDGTMYFMSSIGAYSSNPNDVYAIYRPENSYSCPTHQMAMKWLREIFHIHIRLIHSIDESYTFEIYPMAGKYRCKCFEDYTYYSFYEEAVEVALKYVLENLI